MATLFNVRIQNFKGIEDLTIDLFDLFGSNKYVTLVGLNESGKTTILEALSHSILADQSISLVVSEGRQSTDLNDLIPKHEKAAFTGSIRITSTVYLNTADIKKVVDFIKSSFGYRYVDKIPKTIKISRVYSFVDSVLSNKENTWDFSCTVRKTVTSNPKDFTHKNLKDEWIAAVGFIAALLPKIIYFPTFLVDFPKRIYLQGSHGKVNEYYRDIIDGVLDSLPKSLSLKTHIIDRVARKRAQSAKNLSNSLRNSQEGQQIDATIAQIAAELNRVIFGAWNEIFGRQITGRQINVEWHIEENNTNDIFLEIYIVAGRSRYYLSERSLGFRWFFSFLLFTQFQRSRSTDSNLIFLFDEPASHLHARAQSRLLESFEKIAQPNHQIVYSTHSHYLINPIWLEQAYIVRNSALEVDDDDPNTELSDIKNHITAVPYKKFVSSNPTQMTYFQPVLDAIDYRMSPLLIHGRAVIVEGKFDFYPFKYLLGKSSNDPELQIFPACGAGAMNAIISLLRAWSRPFVILLDDDAAGRREKKRYREQFLLSELQVVTLADLDVSLSGKAFEAIYRPDLDNLFDQYSIPRSSPVSKYDYHMLFQYLTAVSPPNVVMNDTLASFGVIVSSITARLDQQ